MRFLDKYLAREKDLRRLAREAERLWQARRDAPIIPLERPYQSGWIKTYVLDDRIERRPDAQLFRNILHVINTSVYSRARSFMTRGGPIVLRPRLIGVRDWEKLAWPASHQRFFKFGTWRIEDLTYRLDTTRYKWTCGFKLVRDEWLQEDVQPYLITHQRVVIPEVESRLAAIDAHMAQTHGWDQLHRLRGRRVSYWRRYGSRPAEDRATLDRTDQLRQLSLIDT